jgi:hypothetical protein
VIRFAWFKESNGSSSCTIGSNKQIGNGRDAKETSSLAFGEMFRFPKTLGVIPSWDALLSLKENAAEKYFRHSILFHIHMRPVMLGFQRHFLNG